MLKRLILSLATLFFCAAAAAQKPTEGVEYLSLNPPQSTDAPGKVEVVEFFWYRCPHCYTLEPYLASWVKKLPQDTRFRRFPAVFNEEWALDARIFYALEALGQLERLHGALFDAIHKQGGASLKGQTYAKWVAAWLAKQGVDTAKYEATLRSFSVDSKVKRAMQTSQAYKLDGVPAIAINGRYMVSASMVGDRQGMIDAAEQILAQARRKGVAKK